MRNRISREEVGQYVRCSTQTRCIRNSTVHYAGHHRQIVLILRVSTLIEHDKEETKHYQNVEQNRSNSQYVHTESTFTEGREETGPYLQTNAIDKKDKTQLLDEVNNELLLVHHFGKAFSRCIGFNDKDIVEMANQNADKQDERYAKRNAADFHFTQLDAEPNHQRKDDGQMGRAKGLH